MDQTPLPTPGAQPAPEDSYAREIADLHKVIDMGQDPASQSKFLLHLLETSLDPSLNEDEKRKEIGVSVAKLSARMSESARASFQAIAEVHRAPPEIIAAANGSSIKIEDVDEILRVLRRDGKAEIFKGSAFKTQSDNSIEHITSTAWLNEQRKMLSLQTKLVLNPRIKWNVNGMRNRFKNFFPRTNQEGAYLVRDGLLVMPTQWNNSYFVKDGNGAIFEVLVWMNEDQDKNSSVVIRNYSMTEGKDIKVPSPTLDDVSAAEQLKTLGRVTALVADFCATLRTSWTDTTPAEEAKKKRAYVVNNQLKRKYVFSVHNIEHIAASLDFEYSHNSESVTFDDIGGYDEVKKELEEAALLFANRETSKKWDVAPPQGILMYGPPGTGKTTLARALANEIGADFRAIGSTDIYDMYVGSSGKKIKAIFDELKAAQKPTVVFFDEIESFIRKGKSSGDVTGDEVAGIFKRELNGLAEANPNVIVVAATNDLDAIDPSIIRAGRFDLKVEVPLPDERDRTDILAIQVMRGNKTPENRVFAEDFVPIEVAQETDGLSGADLVEVLRRLKRKKAISEINKEPVGPITQQEFLDEMAEYREDMKGQS